MKVCKKQKFRLIAEQTAAARNDVTAKKFVSGCFKTLADCPKTGLLVARAISIEHTKIL